MPKPNFTSPVQNLNKPHGQIAQRLREIVVASPFDTIDPDLADSTTYQPGSLSDAMRGKGKQSVEIITAIVNACIADPVAAQATIDELVALRNNIPASVPPVEENRLPPTDADGPPSPPRPGWRQRRGLLAVLAIVVVLVVVVVVALTAGGGTGEEPPAASCGPGVTRIAGECIGVTDGSTTLMHLELANVLSRIHTENIHVISSGQAFVSVAYLIPAGPIPTGIPGQFTNLPTPALVHELQGAFIAQLEANETKTVGNRPLVRLLVANAGAGADHGDVVVPQLVAMADPAGPDKLVAVAATGKSTDTTKAMLTALTDAKIPVITTRLSADTILNTTGSTDSQPLARIAPTNTDQVHSLVTYLRTTPKPPTRALLVQNSSKKDIYAQTLGTAFTDTFPKPALDQALITPSEFYDPGATSGDMTSVLTNVCLKRPDLVLFAGRSVELIAFVEALPQRPCPDLHLTVITGSDAVDFAAAAADTDPKGEGPAVRAGLDANVTVYYSGLASPGAWPDTPPAPGTPDGPVPTGAYRLLQKTTTTACTDPNCYSAQFRDPTDTLDDGAAIMGHDAIRTAVAAIRTGGINDTPARVAQTFRRLHGPSAIPLASGWLSLDSQTGAAVNKATAIVQVQPDGTLKFITLTGPDGTSCTPQRTTC